ncbi:MAG: hypothetical protein LBU46_00360 [Candidatus Accumulibacter sp.]|jgi:hypothetical protein|nr:hypothetical protein [Accumulibacter sp.]
MDKQVERDFQHFQGFGEAFGFSVESCKLVANTPVRAFYEMSLRFRHRSGSLIFIWANATS